MKLCSLSILKIIKNINKNRYIANKFNILGEPLFKDSRVYLFIGRYIKWHFDICHTIGVSSALEVLLF